MAVDGIATSKVYRKTKKTPVDPQVLCCTPEPRLSLQSADAIFDIQNLFAIGALEIVADGFYRKVEVEPQFVYLCFEGILTFVGSGKSIQHFGFEVEEFRAEISHFSPKISHFSTKICHFGPEIIEFST